MILTFREGEMASFSFNLLGDTGRGQESSEEIQAAQSRTFTYWINLTLKRKSLKVSDLYDDLESGVLLIRLMECLAPGKKMPGR